MDGKRIATAGAVLFLVLATALPAVAQPAAPGFTLWRFLGIPQFRDSLRNRSGFFPNRERTPPLKRIADPANFESDNPAIKAAAEIKYQEDLKKQKLKAIRYLADVGCGCYDKDDKVTEALIAAMDDCTEDVRLAAVKAISSTSRSNRNVDKCLSTSCCGEDVVNKLADIAYERDDKGCYKEPSEEVREAAIAAIRRCCPGKGPAPQQVIEMNGETGQETGGEGVIPTPPPTPEPEASFYPDEAAPFTDSRQNGAPVTSRRTARQTTPVSFAGQATAQATLSDNPPQAAVSRHPAVIPSAEVPAAQVEPSRDASAEFARQGVIEFVDSGSDRSLVRIPQGQLLKQGARMRIYHKALPLGVGGPEYRSIAVVEVVESRPGIAEVRLLSIHDALTLTRGDLAVVSE